MGITPQWCPFLCEVGNLSWVFILRTMLETRRWSPSTCADLEDLAQDLPPLMLVHSDFSYSSDFTTSVPFTSGSKTFCSKSEDLGHVFGYASLYTFWQFALQTQSSMGTKEVIDFLFICLFVFYLVVITGVIILKLFTWSSENLTFKVTFQFKHHNLYFLWFLFVFPFHRGSNLQL